MKNLQKGFTLIELMIVVAIIGILAAVAIPAYQDYTARAKISEVVTVAGGMKTSLSEYYQSTGAWPADLATGGIEFSASDYVAGQTYSQADGVLQLSTQNINTTVNGNWLTFKPTVNTGSIVWQCYALGNVIADKYLPTNCRGGGAT